MVNHKALLSETYLYMLCFNFLWNLIVKLLCSLLFLGLVALDHSVAAL